MKPHGCSAQKRAHRARASAPPGEEPSLPSIDIAVRGSGRSACTRHGIVAAPCAAPSPSIGGEQPFANPPHRREGVLVVEVGVAPEPSFPPPGMAVRRLLGASRGPPGSQHTGLAASALVRMTAPLAQFHRVGDATHGFRNGRDGSPRDESRSTTCRPCATRICADRVAPGRGRAGGQRASTIPATTSTWSIPCASTLVSFLVGDETSATSRPSWSGAKAPSAALSVTASCPPTAASSVKYGGPFDAPPGEHARSGEGQSSSVRYLSPATRLPVGADVRSACNAIHSIEQRAAKWITSAIERTATIRTADQERLASMLGVGRSYASRVIPETFKADGIADAPRLEHDLDALEARACRCNSRHRSISTPSCAASIRMRMAGRSTATPSHDRRIGAHCRCTISLQATNSPPTTKTHVVRDPPRFVLRDNRNAGLATRLKLIPRLSRGVSPRRAPPDLKFLCPLSDYPADNERAHDSRTASIRSPGTAGTVLGAPLKVKFDICFRIGAVDRFGRIRTPQLTTDDEHAQLRSRLIRSPTTGTAPRRRLRSTRLLIPSPRTLA